MHGQSETATTPEEYIAELDSPRKEQIQQLHDLIHQQAPSLEPHIDMGAIGYGRMHYVYESGREGDCAVIGLASNKRAISLYFSTLGPDGDYLPASFKDRLPRADVGKSCVRFTTLDKVDTDVLKEMVAAASASTLNPRS